MDSTQECAKSIPCMPLVQPVLPLQPLSVAASAILGVEMSLIPSAFAASLANWEDWLTGIIPHHLISHDVWTTTGSSQ